MVVILHTITQVLYYMIKALFFDVDGTLVSFNTHTIPTSTVDALKEAKKRGVKLFIATGRPIQLLNNIPEVEHLMDGYILATGALCTYEDKVVREDLIPQAEVEALIDFCKQRSLPAVVVGREDIQLVNRNEQFEDIFRNLLNVSYNKFDVLMDEVINQGVLQITPFITEDEEDIIKPQLKSCASARWHPAFCDINNSSADKANGIRAIAQQLGIDISETMAFGDGGNDISMLKAAGTSVAMGNALDKVKASATYVTTSVDEDGIANALRHFGII